MSDPIRQEDHFFAVGDRVVNIKGDYKKMSYNDVLRKSLIYVVTVVIDKHVFKVKMLNRGI
jgi:hypothetical protein